MLVNPLETLIENTSAIYEDISPAKTAYILSQLLKETGYDEFTQNTLEEVSLSETSQEDAIKTLSSIISGIHSGQSYEEAIIIAFEVEELVEEVEQTVVVSPLAEDRLAVATDIIKEVVTLSEERIFINHSQENVEDIHRYIIPLVLARLDKEGSTIENDNDKGEYTRLYESNKSIVKLNVSPGIEHLTFDRKASLENESARVLEATRESSQLRFEIIVNNITQIEIDKIKVIAQQEAQKKAKSRGENLLSPELRVHKVMSKTQLEELG
ncbi:MAG: hypothetical protein PUP92_36855 [Rhizonema sp. PD38]|nr:hypothetical protein [Rhizonema sp. PD38]